METKKKMKLISALTLFLIVAQIFSPFADLMSKSYAAVTVPKPAVVLRRNSDVQTTASGTKYFTIQFAFVGNYLPYSFDFKLKYDKTKIAPANKTNPDNDPALITLMMNQDGIDYGFTTQIGTATTYLNKNEGSLRLIAVGGSISPTDLGPMHGYDGYLPVYTLSFKFLDKNATTDDITTDLIELMPVDRVLPTGMKVIYIDGGNKNYTDPSYLKFDNFKEAAKKVKSIAIKNNPTKTTYNHGDAINLAGGNLEVTYTDGSKGTVPMTDSGVTIKNGNPANVNNKKVTLEYQGYTAEFPITVNDPVNSIQVTTPPTKKEYTQDEPVKLDGGVLTVTTKSGAKSTINLPNASVTSNVTKADLTAGDVTITGSTPEGLKRGIQRVTLTHQGKTTKFDIIVNDTVKSISISNPKTDYRYGENLDRSKGTIKVSTTSGASIDVPLSNGSATITGYTPNKLGSQTLTVTYLGKSATYNVNVEDYVDSIEVKEPNKVVYNYGEQLDLTGGTVTDVYKSGNKGTPTNLTNAMISGYNPNLTGRQTVTVTKDGKKTTFEVIVNDVINGIRVSGLKTEYKYGENLDLTGAKVQLTMASGSAAPAVTLTQDMIKTPFNPNQVGKQTLTVEYQGKQTTVVVNVTDILTGIQVKDTEKPKDSYKYGEAVNKTQGKIIATYKSGASKDIAISNGSVKLQNENGTTFTTTGVTFPEGQTTVTKNMKISYTENGVEKTTIMPVIIINQMTGIQIQGNPKTQYNVNEEFEKNLNILVTRNQGVIEAIPVTEDMVSGFSTTTEGTREATITYTENGITKTLTYTYTVTDNVISIKLKTQPNKTTYEYGDAIDLTGATIEVVKGSGTETIPVTKDMISSYNANKLGKQELTVSYGGKTATDKIVVNVNDKVIGIKVTPPTKVNYQKGEALDLNGGKVTKIMASGAKGESVTLTQDMLETTFDSSKPGPQDITVNLNGFKDKFTVRVEDFVTGITIKETPKNKYSYGEALGNPGGKLTVTWKSGATTEVSITPDMITELDGSVFDTTKIDFETGKTTAKKEVKVTYEGAEAKYEITIVNEIENIRPQTNPKTEYVIGEDFEEGLSILVERQDGVPEAIEVTEDMLEGFDTSTEGKKQVTIKYEENGIEKEYTYEINVSNPVTGMELEGTPKTEYLVGENLDLSGLNVLVHRPGGDERIPVTQDMVSGYNPDKLGKQTVTVTYNGQKVGSYDVNVSDYIGGVVITPPSKVQYEHGEELDLSDSKVTITMASSPDKPKVVQVTKDMVTGYDPNKTGPQTVTITYTAENGKTYKQDFVVNVADAIKSVTLDKTGLKTQYKYGDNLDLNNVYLNVTYESGKTQRVPVNTGMISGYNPNKLGSQTVTVTYQGFENTFGVQVIDWVKDIKLTPPTKNTYRVGEKLSLVGGRITEVMASGATGITLDLTPSMVTGFDSSTPGTKKLTVTYTKDGKTFKKEFEVVVENKNNHIEVIAPNKTDYKYGEALNLTGGKVVIVKDDGTKEEKVLTKDMVSGYNPNKPGQQVITVTYKDEAGEIFTGSFVVNVGEDYVVNYKFTAPSKTNYVIGEDLNLKGGKITEILASGKVGQTIEITKDMTEGFNPNKSGKQTITVNYKGNKFYYTVTVGDRIIGISIKKYPNKIEYQYGEALDVTGGILNVVKDSGIYEIEITKDMVSGFNPNKSGIQILTIKYQGFVAQYMVYVVEEKEETPDLPITPPTEEPTEPTKPTLPTEPTEPTAPTKPTRPVRPIKPTTPEKVEDVEDTKDTEETEEQPIIPPVVGNNDDNNNPPTDGNKDAYIEGLIAGIAGTIIGLGTILGCILLIILFVKERRNVKVYIEEGNEKVLVGKEKITKEHKSLDLNKYYDRYKEDEYKIVLSKAISKKLDKETINLTVHDKKESFTVDYKDEAYTYRT